MTPGELKILMALDKLAGRSYQVITGIIRQTYDYDIEYSEITNETPYITDGTSISEGQIKITVDAFDPLVYDVTKIQLFISPSLDARNTIGAYPLYEGNPWLEVFIESRDISSGGFNGVGLGTTNDAGLAFEIRLYKLV